MEDFKAYSESLAMIILSFAAIGALITSAACIVLILFNCCYNLIMSKNLYFGWISSEIRSKCSLKDYSSHTSHFSSAKESFIVSQNNHLSHIEQSYV